MGKTLLYVGCGYLLLVLLSSALLTGPGSLPVLVLVGIVALLYRSGRLRGLRLQTGEAPARVLRSPPPPDDRALAEALRYRRRFGGASRRLASALPEDPLRSDALVAVLALYLHEPVKERAGIEDEYRRRRAEFLAWREEAQRLGSPQELEAGDLCSWLEEAEGLDSRLSALEAYVADIQARAEAAEGLPHAALECLTRAGDAIGAAATACAAVADPHSIQALNQSLAAAQARYREAWTAVDKGKERPLTAIRLADEAADLAADVQRRAVRITTLPGEIEENLRDLGTSIEKLGIDLEHVRKEFETAAASYAPSSWHEIGGFGRAAERDLERARQLHESAARLAQSYDPAQLERAEQAAREAILALDDAARLRAAIKRHLEKLERAAVEAREVVLRAEQDVDQALAAVHEHDGASGENELLRRATDLVERARDGLSSPQPDWLAIVELAGRGSELARQAARPPSSAVVGLAPLRLAIEDAKARAKESRDSAWAQAIVKPATADRAPSLLRATEDSYRAALSLEASLEETPDEGSLEAVVAAFEEAERMAAGFLGAAKRVEVDGAKPDGGQDTRPAHALVWSLDLSRTART
jgi:hypothetical protein